MAVRATLLLVLNIITFLIFVRAILSWFPIGRGSRFIQFVYQITEPILGPIRDMIQRSAIGGNLMIDFSPIIAWLIIDYLLKPLIMRYIYF